MVNPRRGTWSLAALCLLVFAALAAGAAPTRAAAPAPPRVAAGAAIVVDRVTGRVLWSKRPDLRLQMASTTKIMTLLIVLEHRRDVLDDSFVVSDIVAGESGVGLQPGARITYRAAITGMIVRSATDCADALAVDVAGDATSFVALMNEHARAWGMTGTYYTNPSGAPDDPAHVSCARDLAKLGRRAMRDPLVREFVTIKEQLITWETGSFLCHSRNTLLDYQWGEGVKPGYTPVAKYCLVGAGTPGLRPLVSVTLREPSRDLNMGDSAALLRYGETFFHRVAVVRRGTVVARAALPDGNSFACLAARSLTGVVVRRRARIRTVVSWARSFTAAPPAGTLAGTVTYRADGETLGTVDLYAKRLP